MRRYEKFALLMLLAAGPLVFLIAACNDATDDPEMSEAQLLVSTVLPQTACADIDGSPEDINGDGTDELVFTDFTQLFTIQSRVRGTADTGNWTDAHLSTVTMDYFLDTGSLPSLVDWPINVNVPSDGTSTVSLVTVPAQYSMDLGNQGISTLGRVRLRFKGADASGEPVTLETQVAFGTYNACVR